MLGLGVNAYTQKGALAIAFRKILHVPKLDELGLPKILHSFTGLRQGFILVTGPTGHGKSTTLASMLNEINFNGRNIWLRLKTRSSLSLNPKNQLYPKGRWASILILGRLH